MLDLVLFSFLEAILDLLSAMFRLTVNRKNNLWILTYYDGGQAGDHRITAKYTKSLPFQPVQNFAPTSVDRLQTSVWENKSS